MSETVSQHEEEALGQAYDPRLMPRLLTYLRPYRGMTVGALALIVVSSVLQLFGPLAVAVSMDLFIRPQGPKGNISAVSAFVRDQMLARGVDPAQVAHQGLAVTALLYLV